MKLKIYQIDAFTDVVFKGNYAAVIITDEWLDDSLMEKIAMENNLSETAFAKKCSEELYEIRWFSPMTEIDFCGHATLATAFVLFSNSSLKEVTFRAKAVGDLKVNKKDDGYIQMKFPKREPTKVEEIPEEILQGLSREPQEVLVSQQAYFAIYPNEEDVLNIEVDLDAIKKLKPLDVVVTSPSKREYDFISRYFWPANGGVEDPVTGSIHAGLAPLWAKRLQKDNLLAYQASSRGGVLKCEVDEESVVISGKAVQYLEGYISI